MDENENVKRKMWTNDNYSDNTGKDMTRLPSDSNNLARLRNLYDHIARFDANPTLMLQQTPSTHPSCSSTVLHRTKLLSKLLAPNVPNPIVMERRNLIICHPELMWNNMWSDEKLTILGSIVRKQISLLFSFNIDNLSNSSLQEKLNNFNESINWEKIAETINSVVGKQDLYKKKIYFTPSYLCYTPRLCEIAWVHLLLRDPWSVYDKQSKQATYSYTWRHDTIIHKLSAHDDRHLLKCIHEYPFQWYKIAEVSNLGITPFEALQRYQMVLNNNIEKKGHWTALEDSFLSTYVRICGEGKWRAIANLIGERSADQCMWRWQKILRVKSLRALLSRDKLHQEQENTKNVFTNADVNIDSLYNNVIMINNGVHNNNFSMDVPWVFEKRFLQVTRPAQLQVLPILNSSHQHPESAFQLQFRNDKNYSHSALSVPYTELSICDEYQEKIQERKKNSAWNAWEDCALQLCTMAYGRAWRNISQFIGRAEGACLERFLVIENRRKLLSKHSHWSYDDAYKLLVLIRNAAPNLPTWSALSKAFAKKTRREVRYFIQRLRLSITRNMKYAHRFQNLFPRPLTVGRLSVQSKLKTTIVSSTESQKRLSPLITNKDSNIAHYDESCSFVHALNEEKSVKDTPNNLFDTIEFNFYSNEKVVDNMLDVCPPFTQYSSNDRKNNSFASEAKEGIEGLGGALGTTNSERVSSPMAPLDKNSSAVRNTKEMEDNFDEELRWCIEGLGNIISVKGGGLKRYQGDTTTFVTFDSLDCDEYYIPLKVNISLNSSMPPQKQSVEEEKNIITNSSAEESDSNHSLVIQVKKGKRKDVVKQHSKIIDNTCEDNSDCFDIDSISENQIRALEVNDKYPRVSANNGYHNQAVFDYLSSGKLVRQHKLSFAVERENESTSQMHILQPRPGITMMRDEYLFGDDKGIVGYEYPFANDLQGFATPRTPLKSDRGIETHPITPMKSIDRIASPGLHYPGSLEPAIVYSETPIMSFESTTLNVSHNPCNLDFSCPDVDVTHFPFTFPTFPPHNYYDNHNSQANLFGVLNNSKDPRTHSLLPHGFSETGIQKVLSSKNKERDYQMMPGHQPLKANSATKNHSSETLYTSYGDNSQGTTSYSNIDCEIITQSVESNVYHNGPGITDNLKCSDSSHSQLQNNQVTISLHDTNYSSSDCHTKANVRTSHNMSLDSVSHVSEDQRLDSSLYGNREYFSIQQGAYTKKKNDIVQDVMYRLPILSSEIAFAHSNNLMEPQPPTKEAFKRKRKKKLDQPIPNDIGIIDLESSDAEAIVIPNLGDGKHKDMRANSSIYKHFDNIQLFHDNVHDNMTAHPLWATQYPISNNWRSQITTESSLQDTKTRKRVKVNYNHLHSGR